MNTSKTIKIKIYPLPEEAKIGNILPGINNNPIAAPPLCDASCGLIFEKKTFSSQNKKVLLRVWRYPINQIWRVLLILEETYTPSKNYYDILYEDSNNNKQSSNKDEFVFVLSCGYKNP